MSLLQCFFTWTWLFALFLSKVLQGLTTIGSYKRKMIKDSQSDVHSTSGLGCPRAAGRRLGPRESLAMSGDSSKDHVSSYRHFQGSEHLKTLPARPHQHHPAVQCSQRAESHVSQSAVSLIGPLWSNQHRCCKHGTNLAIGSAHPSVDVDFVKLLANC